MNSSAANFISAITGVDYGIPGLQYNRPWVRVADTWNALLDSGASPANMSLPGTMDGLQLHHTIYGAYLAAKAFKTKLDADYPSAISSEQRPTRNNWWAARGVNSGTSYSGTLPASMRSAATGGVNASTLIALNGDPIGKVDTTTGAITAGNGSTAIASGTLNFATGAWSITFSSASAAPLNAQIWFEQDIGNYDLASFTEGTIGRNALMNGLMDMTPASGSNLIATVGTTTLTGTTSSQVPYGWALSGGTFNTAITNGTATLTLGAVTTGDGYPRLTMEIEGSHTAAATVQLTNSITNTSKRVPAGSRAVCGARICYMKHSTIGKFYGTEGVTNTITWQHSSYTVNTANGTAAITFTATRTLDGVATIYLDDTLLDAAGGSFDLYRLSAQADLTGRVFSSGTHTLIITTDANVPFAGKFGFGQVQVRKRNDV